MYCPCSVVCEELGYASGEARCGAYYSPGDGDTPIHLGAVGCRGDEGSVVDCQWERTEGCTHNNDASVYCLKPGQLYILL